MKRNKVKNLESTKGNFAHPSLNYQQAWGLSTSAQYRVCGGLARSPLQTIMGLRGWGLRVKRRKVLSYYNPHCIKGSFGPPSQPTKMAYQAKSRALTRRKGKGVSIESTHYKLVVTSRCHYNSKSTLRELQLCCIHWINHSDTICLSMPILHITNSY